MTRAVMAAQAPSCQPGELRDTPPQGVQLLYADSPRRIPNKYILAFDDNIPPEFLIQTVQRINSGQVNSGQVGLKVAAPITESDILTSSLMGFVIRVADPPTPAAQQQLLLRLCGVRIVDVDQELTYHATQNYPPAGLDRTDQRLLPLNHIYTFPTGGQLVHVYVIDSGIDTAHPDFGSPTRASMDYTIPTVPAATGTSNDCNGHGTAVASVIGGTTFGVAKTVRLHAVRVADVSCGLSFSNILLGINWVKGGLTSGLTTRPAVVNISLGGSRDPMNSMAPIKDALVDAAVTELSLPSGGMPGVPVVTSAGNDHDNACDFSPGGAMRAITVGALQVEPGSGTVADPVEAEASFSNFGSCVELYAPGVSVDAAAASGVSPLCPTPSPWSVYNPPPWSATNPPWSKAMQCHGTSMAAPYVTGCVARFLQSLTIPNPPLIQIITWLRGATASNHMGTGGTNTANWHGITSSHQAGSIAGPTTTPLPVDMRHPGTKHALNQCG